MKEYLVHLMKYNQNADRQVSKLLEGLSEAQRELDRKSYYKSLYGLFAHIVMGAMYFQKVLKASCPEISGLTHKYMEYKIDPVKSGLPAFSELQAAIEILDGAIVEMASSLTDEDLNMTITLTLPKIKLEYPLGVFIMQYANHGTHHRGQISQILDEMGIDNNFSGIAPKYE